ncbi:MAG TPA: pitrilysin family protein [Polyangia bacterium]
MRLPPLLFMAVLASCSSAQTWPLAPPPPSTSQSAPAIPNVEQDGDVTVAMVHGVRLLVRRLPGAEFVSASLFVEGGANNWTEANAGVESMALYAVADGGPASLGRAAYHQQLTGLFARISAVTSVDFSELRAKAPLAAWPQTFQLMLDAFRAPALPTASLEFFRSMRRQEIENEALDPEAHLRFLARRHLFQKHPFSRTAGGTLETLSRLDGDALRIHLDRVRAANRLLLVVAGDLDPQTIIDKAAAFVDLPPSRTPREARFAEIEFSAENLELVHRPLPISYLVAAFPAPRLGQSAHPAATIAMRVLHTRLYDEIRSKRGLSYAPVALIADDSFLPIGFFSASTKDVNAVLEVVRQGIDRLQSDPVPSSELERTKAIFVTAWLRDLQRTDDIVAFLGRAQLYAGDWRMSRRQIHALRAVTTEQVQAFARAHLKSLQITVLGAEL